MNKILCIYHHQCQDGFAAAWCVRAALGEDAVEFYPGVYQNDPPDVTGRDVVMVDFSYKRPVIEAMAKSARSILILDHHQSAEEDLRGIPQATPDSAPSVALLAAFDMNRSGAGIAWDYFHQQERPRLINHIEDRDLWRFALPRTREISAALFSYPYDFALWDTLMEDEQWSRLVNEGAAIERKHRQDIANILSVVKRRMMIGGIVMPVANMPFTMTSDAGHQMASEAEGVAACFWLTPEGWVFSLRSTDVGPDVSKIAAQYGGGGHARAAGFRVSHDMFMEFIK